MRALFVRNSEVFIEEIEHYIGKFYVLGIRGSHEEDMETLKLTIEIASLLAISIVSCKDSKNVYLSFPVKTENGSTENNHFEKSVNYKTMKDL